MYRTLHPEDDGVSEDDTRDGTIRHILVDADYNDLGFSISKDFFGGEKIAVDAQIKVLYQENESIVGQYIIFCKVYGEQRKKYGQEKRAITETIRICKDRNVLKEYLESKEKEVVDIMMTLFDEEEIWEIYAEDKAKEAAQEAARTAATTSTGRRRKE